MFLEGTFVAALIAAYKRAGKKGKMTPQHEVMYHDALDNIRGPRAPEMFMKLSVTYAKMGYPTQSKNLKMRAEYLSAPDEVKKQRGDAYERGMAQALREFRA